MAKETKRKIFQLHENSYDLNFKSLELKNINKKAVANPGLENRNEIILLDNEFVVLPDFRMVEYSFENLSDEDIGFIHPILICSTTDGYEFSPASFNYTFYTFWQKLNNRYKLILRNRALIFDTETASAFTIPIYLTLKLVIYNDRVYKTIQRMKY